MAKFGKTKNEVEVQESEEVLNEPKASMAVAVEEQKPEPAPNLSAPLTTFFKKYERVAALVDDFMQDLKRFRFDLIQAENQKTALLGQVENARLRLLSIEREAATRMESVEASHRTMIERLTDEKISLQRKSEEYDKKLAQIEVVRRDLERQRVESSVA